MNSTKQAGSGGLGILAAKKAKPPESAPASRAKLVMTFIKRSVLSLSDIPAHAKATTSSTAKGSEMKKRMAKLWSKGRAAPPGSRPTGHVWIRLREDIPLLPSLVQLHPAIKQHRESICQHLTGVYYIDDARGRCLSVIAYRATTSFILMWEIYKTSTFCLAFFAS